MLPFHRRLQVQSLELRQLLAAAVIGQAGTAAGEQLSGSDWQSVQFETTLEDPIVVAGPVTRNGSQPLTVRIRNVSDTGFEWQLDEYDYLDGYHTSERFDWLAVERGTHVLDDGRRIVADSRSIDSDAVDIALSGFEDEPAVFGQIASDNGGQAAFLRMEDRSAFGFEIRIDEEEANDRVHVAEDVHYIAIEQGVIDSGSDSGDGWRVSETGNSVTHVATSIDLPSSSDQAFLAFMQTTIGGDPSTVRIQSRGSDAVDVFIEEEQSANDETNHIVENVAYAAIPMGLITSGSDALLELGDVTGGLVDHGNKLAVNGTESEVRSFFGRARNVWDLEAFDGRVYIGGGNTTTNPGPVNLWAFDHASGQFADRPERTIESEAIENFRVIDGALYVPNSDPTSGDQLKFDRLGEDGVWKTVSASPNLAHVRDMVETADGTLILVGNSRRPYPTVDENGIVTQPALPSIIKSTDGGGTFESAVTADTVEAFGNWFYSVFNYQGRTFATSIRNVASDAGGVNDFNLAIFEYNPDTGLFEAGVDGNLDAIEGAVDQSEFINLVQSPFPELESVDVPDSGVLNLTGTITLKVNQSVEYDGALVYSVNTYSSSNAGNTYLDYYHNTYDFYVKSAMGEAPVSVEFADPNAVGEDVIEYDGVLYALANSRQVDGSYVSYVYATTDPTDADAWVETLRFRGSNLARSFERVEDTFYFGLGYSEIDGDPVGDAGALLSYAVGGS